MICSVRLTPASNEHEWIKALYELSFPIDERRPYDELLRLMERDEAFNVEAIYDDNTLVGFIAHWSFPACRYVEHYAIDAARRGCGLGSEALQLFLARDARPVVLEVEIPTDAMSRRRIAFYRRFGFILHDTFSYIQPAYTPDSNPVALHLMTCGGGDNCPLEEIASLLHRRVYGVR